MSKTNTTYYKIRHRNTGLYHKGTMDSAWNKDGKTWVTLGKLRMFITNYMTYSASKDFSDFVVVEYLVTETAEKNIADMLDPKKLIEFLSR
jgi:hypothetical protein